MSVLKQTILLIWSLLACIPGLRGLSVVKNRAAYNTINQSAQRYHHMDERLPEDVEDVLELSAVLEVREYDFFDLAYRWWFGRRPNSQVLESHFARYMFNKIVPHWVRNYCRMILDLQKQGKLDKEELGISRLPEATPQSVRAGLRYLVMILMTMGLLILIAELAIQFNALPCMFPPCY